MKDLLRKSVLQHFGITSPGFHTSRCWSAFRDDIKDAVLNNQIVVMPGEVGAGKTVLFNSAQRLMPEVKFVNVRNYYKENCTISSVINAAIYDLSQEGPKRDLEARSRQFIRVLGNIVSDKNKPVTVCIVIEEAHRLHKNTLRALKELHEAEFAGISPLFSVMLIGHPQLMEVVKSRREVLWRSLAIELDEANGWMQLDERIMFVKNVFGKAVSEGACKTIAQVCRQPLEIVKYVYDKMKAAKAAGYNVINSDVVRPTLKELFNNCGLSLGEISKGTNIPRSTIHAAVHDGSFKNEETKRRIEAFINSAVKQDFAKAS